MVKSNSLFEGFMSKSYVYILTNDHRTVLYTGCTNDLRKRLYHHKNRLIPGFSKRYNAHILVYFEVLPDSKAARLRERKIKGITRQKKDALVTSLNPTWRDLMDCKPSMREDGSE